MIVLGRSSNSTVLKKLVADTIRAQTVGFYYHQRCPHAPSSHRSGTGTEMIIWGGFSDLGDVNDGGSTIRNTDSWIALPQPTHPVRVQDTTAVWTGTEMIVWGGAKDMDVLNTVADTIEHRQWGFDHQSQRA